MKNGPRQYLYRPLNTIQSCPVSVQDISPFSVTERSAPEPSSRGQGCRNLIGFWLLGLCNNFGYVIMLSAAHDILKEEQNQNQTGNGSNLLHVDGELFNNRSGKLIPGCNPIGTGAILLADILPALIIKLTAPWYIQSVPYGLRVALVVGLNAASFPVVATSHQVWLSLLGVVLSSLSSGIGEITFLSLTAHYHKNSVSTWSSGTGAAGVFGALSYAGFTAIGLSPRTTILIMLVIPVMLALSYWVILVRPLNTSRRITTILPDDRQPLFAVSDSSDEDYEPQAPLEEVEYMSFKDKLKLVQPLLKFIIPLMLVYFAEYFINQALFELIFFTHIWLPKDQQYRWYQVIYQVGVFLSRSSVNLFQIHKLWILSMLQFLNVAMLTLQVFYSFLPSLWLVFVFILWEGLLGGATYVNAFYRISNEIPAPHREFSMGVASMGDSLGISLAGAISVPIHNLICKL